MNVSTLFETVEKKIIGEELLAKAHHIDYKANGLQITGEEQVKKIAIGVTCCMEFLEKAARWGADVCIFHHGLTLSQLGIHNSKALPSLDQQLKFAYQHGLNIAGYHYALDSHPKIGNNAQIIDHLGAKRLNIPYFDDWGWVGEFDKPTFVQDVAKDCMEVFRHDVFMVLGGKEKVKRIGVCSGGAKPNPKSTFELLDLGIDLHITGEITEPYPSQAKECGYNYFSCGHYATEVFGIKALGEEIKKAFPKVEVEFIDVWNEL